MSNSIGTSANQLYKKIFGTTGLVVGIIAGLLISSGQVNALFTFINGHINMTGTVLQVHGASFEVDSGGTYPFHVIVDTETDYMGSYSDLADITVGDSIKLMAREDQGNILAQSISDHSGSGYGYGHGCEELRLRDVYVSSVHTGNLVLSRAGITFEVSYGDYTDIVGGDLDDIAVGDMITVIGTDCGDEGFDAKTIVVSYDDPIATCDTRRANAYVVYNDTVLLSHDEGGAFSPVIDVDIPAGTYNVYGVSYDQHDVHTWDTSVLEQWYVTGWSNDINTYTSNNTDDLPDALNRNISQIGTGVAIDGFDALQLVHSHYPEPNYNSILPECVIFEPTEDGGPQTMVLSCEQVPASAHVVHNDQVLLSHDEGGAITPVFPIDLNPYLYDAYYDVYGVSFDHHSENPWDTLPGESWYFELLNGESTVFTSQDTDDLPDNLDRNVTKIAAGQLFNDVDGVRYTHSSFPSPDYRSILPECIVFVPSTAADVPSDDQPDEGQIQPVEPVTDPAIERGDIDEEELEEQVILPIEPIEGLPIDEI